MPPENKHPSTLLKKIVRIGLGIIFLVLGIVGLFLPVLQGILFIIIGLLLLAPYNRCLRKQLAAFKLKHPKLFRTAQSFKKKMKSYVQR